MLNLPSFNRLLPVSNISSHLLKGLMASALLSLSFVSLSSHAATSNLVSPISRAEAANPANFYHLNINGGAVFFQAITFFEKNKRFGQPAANVLLREIHHAIVGHSQI